MKKSNNNFIFILLFLFLLGILLYIKYTDYFVVGGYYGADSYGQWLRRREIDSRQLYRMAVLAMDNRLRLNQMGADSERILNYLNDESWFGWINNLFDGLNLSDVCQVFALPVSAMSGPFFVEEYLKKKNKCKSYDQNICVQNNCAWSDIDKQCDIASSCYEFLNEETCNNYPDNCKWDNINNICRGILSHLSSDYKEDL